MSERDDEALIHRIRAGLDEGIEHLDAATLSRLRQARSRALHGLARRRRLVWVRAAVAAGVLAVTALAVVRYAGVEHTTGLPLVAMEDVDILASGETPDFYEDLDFYTWLAEEHADAG